MNRLLIAVATTTVALAAQAATISWTGTSGSTAIQAGTSFSVATRVTLNEASFATGGVANNSEILQFTYGGYIDGQVGLLAYNGTNTKGLGAHFNDGNAGGNGWTSQIEGTTSGTHNIVLNFAWDGEKQWNVTLYVDNTPVAFQSETVFLPPSNGSTTVTVRENDAWTVESLALYTGGTLTKQDIAWLNDNDTTVVPEPTALALLALGVAGMALRRRLA